MSDSTREIQSYLNQSLAALMQEFELYAEETTGMMKGPGTAWKRNVPVLKYRICVEGNWCEQRQDARFDDPLNVILAVAAMIEKDAIRLTVPATLIAVILFKRGLDRFCDCPPLGSQTDA